MRPGAREGRRNALVAQRKMLAWPLHFRGSQRAGFSEIDANDEEDARWAICGMSRHASTGSSGRVLTSVSADPTPS